MARMISGIGLISSLMLLATACGASADSEPPNTIPAISAPNGPSKIPTVGLLTIGTDVNNLRFNKGKLTANAGDEVVLRFSNTSSALQHNWVLVKNGTKDAVADAGSKTSPSSDWVPPGDERVIANTTLVSPGRVAQVQFTAPPAGTYQFVCTFPGHNAAGMSGEFVVSEAGNVGS